jgi:hypothetical protein
VLGTGSELMLGTGSEVVLVHEWDVQLVLLLELLWEQGADIKR